VSEVLAADRGAPPLPPAVKGATARKVGRYALLSFAAIVVLFPIYSAIVVAIQPASALINGLGVLIPTELSFSAFGDAFDQGHLGQYLRNSLVQSTLTTIAQVVTSVLAAYAFAFLRFPGKRIVFFAFLATLMVPTEVIIVSQYQIVSDLGWLNSYPGLIVPFVVWTFGTFMIRQSFLNVPADLRDATALDGYGHLGFMWHVAIPLARPAIAGLAVFSFLNAWNEYLWPLIVTDSPSRRTVQVGLKSLRSANVDELNLQMAGVLIAAIPIALVLIVFQRHLVRGLTAGAVKG
jgi:ABC-type glycerol-3-phosphate transport system permease component